MKCIDTEIEGVKIFEDEPIHDSRGYFVETFREDFFNQSSPFEGELEGVQKKIDFVQENESLSDYGTLRGLHYQLPPFAQSKLVRVLHGKILDVAVDIRKESPTFGKHVAVELSDENRKQLFIPQGFAHGFVVLSETAKIAYKVDNYYSAEHDRGILFSDNALGIDWKIEAEKMILSKKDSNQPLLKNAEVFLEKR